MTPAQIALVQHSYGKLRPIQDQAAALFYDRLFATDPTTRPLFANTDMAEQGQKLMATIGTVVAALDKPEIVVPAAQALAKSHLDYGVTHAHYDSVGAALLWTLEQGLGDAFTPETREAWTAAYSLLATTMRAA